jgi:NAD(P)-dependent dehydrogenase (short-subunit alcohol dehydrogenase family)
MEHCVPTSEDLGKGYDRLAGKTALVTGSTRGLGRVIAEWLARDGADVIVSGRDPADVNRAVEELRGFGTRVHGIPADLSRIADAHALIEASLAYAPSLEIVVNNAGMSIPQPFHECTDADYEYQQNVNLRSPFIICQHVARSWISRGIHGRIVNISTVGVFSAHTDRMVYNMSKAGIQAMTKNMAYELGRHGISVNAVAPGNVPDRPGQPEFTAEERTRMDAAIPLGRLGTAEDIASAVRHFCLPESQWTTGQTLLVDGGMVAFMGQFIRKPEETETQP